VAYVHEAQLIIAEGGDPAAPGGAVTQALCGHWEHEGPCRWPHNNAIDTRSTPARFRTVFVAAEADEHEIRARIDRALRGDDSWSALSSGPRPLADTERPLAERLGSTMAGWTRRT
jgi:hypothetical protein